MRSLLSVGEAPEYVKDNLNVLSGYRREMSTQQALRTVFMWHNETLNIWSHLLAASCFVAFLLALIIMPPHEHWPAPKWPLAVFEVGAAYTFSISALFHTFLCISKQHYGTWRKLDFTAILVVMFSMFWPFCYYAFGCTEDVHKWFVVYVTVAAGLSSLCLVVCLLPVFQTNAFHASRPMVFAVLGIWGVAPVVHAAVLFWDVCAVRTAVFLCAAQLVLHTIGAVFYATQFPERVTRRADYYSSHFIFHVLVFVGLVAFHEGTRVLYLWRNSEGGCMEHGHGHGLQGTEQPGLSWSWCTI